MLISFMVDGSRSGDMPGGAVGVVKKIKIMSKRMFQILDEMNVHDTQHGTAFVGVCNEMTNVQKVKKGGLVTIGVPAEVVDKILMNGKNISVVLLAIDMNEYNRFKSQPPQQ